WPVRRAQVLRAAWAMHRVAEQHQARNAVVRGHHAGDAAAVGAAANDRARVLQQHRPEHLGCLLGARRKLACRRHGARFDPAAAEAFDIGLHAGGAAGCAVAKKNHAAVPYHGVAAPAGAQRGTAAPKSGSLSTMSYFAKVSWERPDPSPLISHS